jgi:3-dehydroquinate synthase
VIAPGGGALLEPHSRAALEGTGTIVCLMADLETLLPRLNDGGRRPLLEGAPAARLGRLLHERELLYRSFPLTVHADGRDVDTLADEVLRHYRAASGYVRFELGDGSALMGRRLTGRLPELLESKSILSPIVGIADSNVAALHGEMLSHVLGSPLLQIPAGEAHKTLETVRDLYRACLARGLEREGTLVAIGGGVAGDVAGFVAATFMRGVRWVNLPTTVLAMADASLGGKVGVDLPEGKNLVGAFHPPVLIAADFDLLATLPESEVRCGLAEVIKAAIIGDPDLFDSLLVSPPGDGEVGLGLESAIARAAAVKVGIVNADPLERGERARLNFGHTVGHGVEVASGYRLRHGEAIAVGMAAEAWLSETLDVAEAGLAAQVAECLRRAGLPTRASGLAPAAIRAAMGVDKKKAGGRLRFALPRRIGDVAWGVEVNDELLMECLEAIGENER